jgi:hypothetical protein
MARIRVLTALKIKQNLKPGMYVDGLGLCLKVRPGNSKSWILQYRLAASCGKCALDHFIPCRSPGQGAALPGHASGSSKPRHAISHQVETV